MTSARAPGKIILFGEHAVVYGRPAIAAPVDQIQVTVRVTGLPEHQSGVRVRSPLMGIDSELGEFDGDDPLAAALYLILEETQTEDPALQIQIESDIPIASGLGSGAAVTIALARALGEHLNRPLSLEQQSRIGYKVDRLHHGTPSGIDNTVITYGEPIYFVKGQEPQPIKAAAVVPLVIAISSRPSPTSESVALVRERWLEDRPAYEDMFDAIGHVVDSAREDLQSGKLPELGTAMNANHRLLQRLGVSTPELDTLTGAARAAGADGAKLSGGGLGGNVIALVADGKTADVADAFQRAGAVRTIETRLRA